jgi:Ca-activated chloride channel family protein
MSRLARAPARVVVGAAAIVIALSGADGFHAQTFRTGVNLRVLQVAVTDVRGQRIAGLTRGDFTVYEDDTPRAIAQFSTDRAPISLGILVGASGSMAGRRWDDARLALAALLARFTPEDRIFLSAFNTAFHLLVPWTSDHESLLRGLSGLTPNGGTYLYSSVSKALPILDDGPHRKKALVIISDGDDNEKMVGLNKDLLRRAVRQAQQSEALVYVIGIGTAKPPPEVWFTLDADARRRLFYEQPVDVELLKQLSDPTGGYTQLVSSSEQLSSTIISIADDLSAQYTIGFESSPSDGRYHALRVTTRQASDVVRTRAGYESE